MFLEVVLAIILLRNIQKEITNTAYSKFNRTIWVVIALLIVIPILNVVLAMHNLLEGVLTWAIHLVVAAIAYFIIRENLQRVKSILYAFLPLMAMEVVKDSVRLVARNFFDTWENYFEIASLLAFIWMVAALIFTNRQRKALAAERRRAEEKEREYQITQRIKADLEIQVRDRTNELIRQKEELQQTLNELKSAQSQLIQSEKMASLGELTAGIAHEIQNPLNFVNNFSEVSRELVDELLVESQKPKDERDDQTIAEILSDISQNLEKITHHGKRADGIVKGMLQHSRATSGEKEPTDVNTLTDEYLRLAYHGLRAKDKSFNAELATDFDENLPKVPAVPQDLGRVFLNLFTNAFYATQKRKQADESFKPLVQVSTAMEGNFVRITVKDNGTGIPKSVRDKIFQPFFTTKPTGEGTGLGLSMSYDIIKAHNGRIDVESEEGKSTTFTISIPTK